MKFIDVIKAILLQKKKSIITNTRFNVFDFEGSKFWHCSVDIKRKALPLENKKTPFKIYSNSWGGSGLSTNKTDSLLIATSEAVERFTYLLGAKKQLSTDCGITYQNSTDGFAAHPSSTRKAKENAFNEAVERYILRELNAKKPLDISQSYQKPFTVYKVVSNKFPNMVLTILEYYKDGYFSYGFACNPSYLKSFNAAKKELCRNFFLIKRAIKNKNWNCSSNLLEKRVSFFASKEGNSHLKSLLYPSSSTYLNNINSNTSPKVIVDTQISIPNTHSYKIWRIVLELSDELRDTQKKESTFFF